MSIPPTVLGTIRSSLSSLRIPSANDKVFTDECVYSFDSPFSDNGLYINILTFLGIGKDYLQEDMNKTGNRVYIHIKYNQKFPVEEKCETKSCEMDIEPVQTTKPTKLAIGVDGGFMSDISNYEVEKEYKIVVAMTDANDLFSIAFEYKSKSKDFESTISCGANELPEYILTIIKAILDSVGMRNSLQVSIWNADNEKIVSKYAANLKQVNPTNKRIPQDPKQWRDEETGSTENLWLNLSTGYIGGGRKQYDGTGGSGSALNHFKYHLSTTGDMYPLVVKLGTITPHGADVWSYADDEDCLVIDPFLADHLSFWGIDIMQLSKTDKTMGELDVDLNMNHDWTRVLEGQEKLESITGPGFVGLRNIGSSCYMNSLLQTLVTIPEVQERYFEQHQAIVRSCPNNDPVNDFAMQFSKVCVGLLSHRYVPNHHANNTTNATSTTLEEEEEGYIAVSKASVVHSIEQEESQETKKEKVLEKYVVAPLMFKHLVGRGHAEFSGGRQQDVSEYYMHLLEIMNRAERTCLPRLTSTTVPTASVLQFHLEYRYQCSITQQVRRSKLGTQSLTNLLELRIPMDKAVALPSTSSDSTHQESKKQRVDGSEPIPTDTDANLSVPFEECLNAFFAAETMDLFNPTLQQIVPCLKTTRFKTFPRYLMVKLGRYYAGPNWVQVKINAKVEVPELLDLSAFRATSAEVGEVEMPDTEENARSNQDASIQSGAVPMEADPGIVEQLMSMGFSENGSKRAALAVSNADVDTAMNWVFEHMEDPGFNDPVIPTLPPLITNSNNVSETSTARSAKQLPAIDPEVINMLSSMGYTEEQTTAALMATDYNIERAADWLFSHLDDLDLAVAEVLGRNVSAHGDSLSVASEVTNKVADIDDGEGRYELIAIISHLGKNTDHGHYVCHVKKNGQWVLFNDEKVGKCKVAPLGYGFMYLFKRLDAPGSLMT